MSPVQPTYSQETSIKEESYLLVKKKCRENGEELLTPQNWEVSRRSPGCEAEVSQHKGSQDSSARAGQDRDRTISREGKGREKAMPVQSWPGSLQGGVVSHNGSKVEWP